MPANNAKKSNPSENFVGKNEEYEGSLSKTMKSNHSTDSLEVNEILQAPPPQRGFINLIHSAEIRQFPRRLSNSYQRAQAMLDFAKNPPYAISNSNPTAEYLDVPKSSAVGTSEVDAENTTDIPNSPLNKFSDVKKNPHIPNCIDNCISYFDQYCSASGMHGVRYIGEHGRFIVEKIFWITIITAVWCTCIILIIKTYQKWIASPVLVTFATTETPIWTIPFPAVTICPEAKFDPEIFNYSDVFLRKIVKEQLTDIQKEYFQSASLICRDGTEILESAMGLTEENINVNDSAIYRIIEMVPENANDNLTSFYWLDEEFKPEDLISTRITEEGLCFSFNQLDYSDIFSYYEEYLTNRTKDVNVRQWSLENGYPNKNIVDSFPRRTFASGMSGGFQALFYTNRSHLDYICNSLQGFKVTLHHPSELANLYKHFRLPLDQAVLVAIKPKMITISEELKSYKPEERNCYLTHEKDLEFFRSYTQQNCMDECLSHYMMLKCKCVAFHMPKYDKWPICGSARKNCLEDSKVDAAYHTNCSCLPSCTSLQYEVEISQTDWSWSGMFKSLGSIYNKYADGALDYDQAHMSLLIVYYKDMQFLTTERHELYGTVAFFSNIGGLLGLFIGFSVTSAIEIFYFLTLRLVCNIKKYGSVFWASQKD